MSYQYLENVAIADVAFEASGKTLVELFSDAALAVTNTMVKDVKTLEQRVTKKVELEAENPEMLLYRFLQELVFFKDAELLLFNRYDLEISQEIGKWRLNATIHGEELDQEKHELAADVKAVSLHNFNLVKTKQGWQASVIIDV